MKRSPRRRFAYQLAVQLGKVNVERDILRALTAKQFLGWEAYARLEPFNQEWQNYLFASVVKAIHETVYNIMRGKDQKPLELTLEDCLIQVKDAEEEKKKPKRVQTFEEQIAIAKIMVMASQKLQEERSPDK